MDRIAIISDVHANITALNAVLDDIHSRGISRIFCLGDSVTKCCNPDLVIDKLRENCEVVLRGNCDESISSPNAKLKSFWSRVKIGEERANYLHNLPVMAEFYMSVDWCVCFMLHLLVLLIFITQCILIKIL